MTEEVTVVSERLAKYRQCHRTIETGVFDLYSSWRGVARDAR